MFAPLRKGTLLIPSGPISAPAKKHLFVVLNDPYGEDELVLLASFSTYKTEIFCDDTCVIEGHGKEHPFLVVQSFVRYQKLRIEPAAKLVAGVSAKLMTPSFPLSEALFERVCAGVHASPYSALKFQKFLAEARAAGC